MASSARSGDDPLPTAPTGRILAHLADVTAAEWDRLFVGGTPFTSFAFLETLERAGCVSPEAGWMPAHLTLWRGLRLVAAAPAYIKADSMGDFSRDWGWPPAFERAGIPYYPKLVVGVPFSPVSGQRFGVAPGEDHAGAIAGLLALARGVAQEAGISSIQVLFALEEEVATLATLGMSPRIGFQFHWYNKGFQDRDAFLSTLRSKRRTQLRREWRAPEEHGVALRTLREAELRAEPLRWAKDAFRLYERTVDRYMWRDPYLNQAFFDGIFQAMPQHVELVVAERGGEVIAGALNLAAPGRLWGRYWGCFEEVPLLHFGVCLYHSIDECITRGVEVFEGGEGGPHKLSRGFIPARTHHALHVLDPGLHRAFAVHLARERQAREAELARYLEEL